jgi:hypothetical protein
MRYSLCFVAAIAATVSAHGVVTEIQGANGVNMPGLSGKYRSVYSLDHTLTSSQSRTVLLVIVLLLAAALSRTLRSSALGRLVARPLPSAAPRLVPSTPALLSPCSWAVRPVLLHLPLVLLPALLLPRALLALPPRVPPRAPPPPLPLPFAAFSTPSLAALVEPRAQQVAPPQAPRPPRARWRAASPPLSIVPLPTTADDGTISMTFHQVNQDGAGPLTAEIDPTSGGTDAAAFKTATVTQNVPGIGIGGLSAASTMDFPVKVQMPAGMTCTGTAGGATNVCVVKMQNSALAGPFGGSAAFTQSTAAKKRAVEFNLRKRHMARGILGKPE